MRIIIIYLMRCVQSERINMRTNNFEEKIIKIDALLINDR
jgi:hypothetical protein